MIHYLPIIAGIILIILGVVTLPSKTSKADAENLAFWKKNSEEWQAVAGRWQEISERFENAAVQSLANEKTAMKMVRDALGRDQEASGIIRFGVETPVEGAE